MHMSRRKREFSAACEAKKHTTLKKDRREDRKETYQQLPSELSLLREDDDFFKMPKKDPKKDLHKSCKFSAFFHFP
jgi:hypothetical protein